MNLPSSPLLWERGTSTASLRGATTLSSAEPPCSASSLSAIMAEGLDDEATDSRVWADKVRDVVPNSFLSGFGSEAEDLGSGGGEKAVFSSSESAIKELTGIEGKGT